MYTSLKFSKQLKDNGCELESDFHRSLNDGRIITSEDMYNFNDYADSVGLPAGSEVEQFIPAYDILNDISVKYVKEFFLEYHYETNHLGDSIEVTREETTFFILSFLQQNKPQEFIEKYIWDNCLFNHKNK